MRSIGGDGIFVGSPHNGLWPGVVTLDGLFKGESFQYLSIGETLIDRCRRGSSTRGAGGSFGPGVGPVELRCRRHANMLIRSDYERPKIPPTWIPERRPGSSAAGQAAGAAPGT